MIVDCRKCRDAGHIGCQCDNDGVLKDGQTIRVGVMLSDSAAATFAIRDYAEQRGVSESQAAYEMRLGDAWKAKPQPVTDTPQPHFGGASPVVNAPTADHGQADYEARLRAAWQVPAA